MEQKKPMSLEQIRAFMAASEEIRFEGRNRKEIYNWVRQTVIEQQYHLQGKAGKGLLRCYIEKTTGLSRAQTTRLIGQYQETGKIESVYKLTSTSDYTGAEHVSVAIECPTGNSLQNVSITVWWGNSLALYLSATDVISSGSFAYRNVGGAVVPVYGPQIMMQVTNAGTTPVSCDQVTTYAVVH
jgi:hypothetical protein